MTPLEGLMMGTRSGSIDPGILFYLRREGYLTEDELADQLDHDSGLVGVSGRTSDVRELLALEAQGDERAALALAIFVRRAAECIAAAATSLRRLDALVFTAGIGENSAAVRARIVARLGAIGVAPIPEVADERGRNPERARRHARGPPDRGARGSGGGPRRGRDRGRDAPLDRAHQAQRPSSLKPSAPRRVSTCSEAAKRCRRTAEELT